MLENGEFGLSSVSCRFGLGRWDEMAKDDRLRLGEKLAVAALEKKQSKEMETDPAFRHLPKGMHLSHSIPGKFHSPQ